MNKYKKRIADELLAKKLKGKGAVLIQGPKWCGKTTTAEQFSKSVLYMDEPERREQNIQLADISQSTLLRGDTPRLIDEWQTVPDIWNCVKDELDNDYQFGKFILTGSSTPADKKTIRHSGAGRITPVKMRPMSLYESEESNGLVSLSELFEVPDQNVFYENKDFTLPEG